MPLALELAAAWVTTLTPAQIACRLDDGLRLLVGGDRSVPRHASLRATLDWSYELLDDGERRLFRRLAVFAGGFDLEAAEGVCAVGDDPPQDVLELLARLVNKSLVVAGQEGDAGTRYHLPETIRQYALERLAASDELHSLQLQHAEYFTNLAEAAEPDLWTVARQDVWKRIERDSANMRAALATAVRSRQAELGLRLAGALGRFWNARGPLTEPCHWLQELLRLDVMVPEGVRAKALVWAGVLLQATGEVESSNDCLRQGLALAYVCGDLSSAAQALYSLGSEANQQRDYGLATELLGQCLALRRELGDQPRAGFALNNLGHVARLQGDYDHAAALFQESLALRRGLDDREGIGQSLQSLAVLARDQRDYARATALFRESLCQIHDLGIVRGVLIGLAWQAGLLAAKGQHEQAARMLGGVSAASRVMGFSPQTNLRADQEATVALVCEHLGRRAFEHAWAEGERLSLDELVEYALQV
jgi:predicted ATPase